MSPFRLTASIRRINIEANDIVRVVNLPSCPKANTMGHAHVEHLGGEFAGLVCTNSLVPLTAEEKSYVVRARTRTEISPSDSTIQSSTCRTGLAYIYSMPSGKESLDFKGNLPKGATKV